MEETTKLISEAIAFHIEGLRQAALRVPDYQSDFAKVETPKSAFQKFHKAAQKVFRGKQVQVSSVDMDVTEIVTQP